MGSIQDYLFDLLENKGMLCVFIRIEEAILITYNIHFQD